MMDVRQREKLKTGLLVGLVLLSFVQVGIHWNRQIQGRPLRLLSSWIQGSSQPLVDERLLAIRKASYVTPVRISITDESSFRWMLDPEGEIWTTAWTDLKGQYLPLLVTGKTDKTQPRETWEQLLASRRMALFEFASPVPASLLPWLGNITSVRNGFPADTFPDVEQIAIVPSENVNATINTLYVLSTAGVHRFTLAVPENALPKRWYVMDQESLDNGNNRQMALISGKYGLNSVRSDILVVDDEIPLPLSIYETTLPAAITSDFSPENLQPLQESVLLNRKDSLLTRLDETTGDVTFSDMENIFRVSQQGRFTYRYMPGATEGAVDVAAAFRQAVAFLDERRRLLGDSELVLTSVSSEESGTPVTVFTFAYRIDGHMVFTTGADGQTIPPVTISAAPDRVLACDWLIRRFSPAAANVWGVFFYDMYNEAVRTYPDLTDDTLPLQCIRTGYRFPAAQTDSTLLPEWFLRTEEGIRTLPMQREVE